MKRLFLFAAYDPQNIVGDSLVLYVRTLSKLGDIVFVADSDIGKVELDKLRSFCLHCEASHHGAYDFGSYRNAFIWAKTKLCLSEYDFIYLINDSVFGPLTSNLSSVMLEMEDMGLPAFSLVYNHRSSSPHMQSWFIGLGPKVFLSDWFAAFLESVSVQKDKETVCELYENGLSKLLELNDLNCGGLYLTSGKKIYNKIEHYSREGLPFVKKSSFTRHCGCLGKQFRKVIDGATEECRVAVLNDLYRIYGKDYVEATLNGSSVDMTVRYLRYLLTKL